MAAWSRRFRSLLLVAALTVGSLAVFAGPARGSAGTCAVGAVENLTTHVTYDNLQGAITAATAGDVLEVAGTCTEIVIVSKDLTIQGKTGTTPTIDGNAMGRTVWVSSAALTLRGLTVTGGAAGDGGGVSLDASSEVLVIGSTISGNAAGFGGGMYNDGTLVVRDSTISGNTATAGSGGGIINNGTLVVRNSTISGNTAASIGGGMHNDGTLVVRDSTISGNTAPAGFGGGIFNSGTLVVRNSTISGNTAAGTGGGIFNYRTVTITDATISANKAPSGAGLFVEDPLFVGALSTVTSSIIAGNTDSGGGTSATIDCMKDSGTIVSGGFNVVGIGDHCGFPLNATDVAGTAVVPLDAQLGMLADNGGPTSTHALLGGPAVGRNTACVGGWDQRGVSRWAGHCDSGAFQVSQPPVPPVPPLPPLPPPWGASGPVGVGGSLSTGGARPDDPLSVAVMSPNAGLVSIGEGSGGTGGYEVLGRVVVISAPDATAGDPLVITFTLDASLFTGGLVPGDVVVLRNGVPVPACSGAAGVASPDPCLASSGMSGNDYTFTVLTSHASTWVLGAREASSGATCRGLVATIVGTAGDDTLTGTSGDDVIWAGAGADVVYGRGGNDVMCLGGGADEAHGGRGRDRVYGNAGGDTLFGGRGRDTLRGGSGDDIADGGPSSDRCLGVETTTNCER